MSKRDDAGQPETSPKWDLTTWLIIVLAVAFLTMLILGVGPLSHG